jgi:hypothetical protein
VAACGGKAPASSGPASASTGRQPWEAKLVTGARFELWPQSADGGAAPLVVTVANVEDQGDARVYTLAWGEGATNGPTIVWVSGDRVVIGEADPHDMQKPWPGTAAGAMCFAQDFSNPEGCDDVCDAALCFSPDGGIISVTGLYAPNYDVFEAR